MVLTSQGCKDKEDRRKDGHRSWSANHIGHLGEKVKS
jgi:hypothetical protein